MLQPASTEAAGQTRRRLALVAALIGTFLGAIDVTVVGTAMPSIVGQLGGLEIFSWVFSIYLLTSTVTVPLYGKAADLFGRRPAFLFSVVLFVGGSLLCATASSMRMLIVWRAVQGLGAGGVMPVTMTIMGDLYPGHQRAKIQGLFSAVWAVSSVVGPAVGALITTQASWRWIFVLNLPFGVASAALMLAALREPAVRRRPRLDITGAAWLTVAATSLMWAMLETGRAGLTDPLVVSMTAVAAVTVLLFIRRERRFPEPMIPPALLRDRVVAVSFYSGLFMGGVLFGISSFVPSFVQGALGGPPGYAAASLLPMGIGWPIASNLAGLVIRRRGYRPAALLGALFLALGAAGLAAFSVRTTMPFIIGVVFVTGLGMGFSATTLLVASQEVVTRQQRGAATSLIQFSRTIGGAIMVAALGALLHIVMMDAFDGRGDLVELADSFLNPHTRGSVGAAEAARVSHGLAAGLTAVFKGVSACGLLAGLVILWFPGRVVSARET